MAITKNDATIHFSFFPCMVSTHKYANAMSSSKNSTDLAGIKKGSNSSETKPKQP
jgi:hypothetical protein